MNAKDEIYSYIGCQEHNGALLVSGKWGCGKSYLVKEIAEELHSEEKAEIIAKKIGTKERYAVVIISLFGIDSIEKLNQKVKEKVFWIQNLNKHDDKSRTKITKTKENVSQIASALSTYSKIASGVNAVLSVDVYNFVEVENTIECWDGSNKINKTLVLVFDDFERSKLDEIELLGSINEYSENRKIKTLIIADETKIKKEENGNNNSEEGSDNGKFSYAEFKEKVVFRTVRLTPKYYDVVNCLVATYNQSIEGYKEFLRKNKNLISQVFIESQSQNIRTLKAVFMDFERVFGIMKDSKSSEEYIIQTMYSFSAISFECKANNYKKDHNYGYLFAESKMKEKYVLFNRKTALIPSLITWVIEGEWKPEEIRCEIEKCYTTQAVTLEYKFLKYDFWSLDYETICNGLSKTLDNAYKGELSCDELISLLEKITAIKIYQIEVPYTVDISKIKEGLKFRESKCRTGEVVEQKTHTFLHGDTIKEMETEMKELYDEINIFAKRQCLWGNLKQFLSYLSEEETASIYSLKNIPIASFDDELLNMYLLKYKQGDLLKKRELTVALTTIDFFTNGYSTEIEIDETRKNLKKLIGELEALQNDEQDLMVKACVGISISQIEEVLNEKRI